MEDIVKKELEALVKLVDIGSEYSIDIDKGDEVSYINISFEGDDLGYLIGNHGKHLDSLQYVFSLILRKKLPEDSNYRVIIDVGGYKEERNKKIESLAMQKADDARILGEEVELTPMSPSDRRVVHMTLQVFDDIKTESTGEGRDRRVKIIPLKEDELGDTQEETPEEQEE
jgi:spoIIIJ-associated protein